MPFECPFCHYDRTVEGAYFEMCARCGWSSVDHLDHAHQLMLKHKDTWKYRGKHYWLACLMEEVGELGKALVDSHIDHPPEWELIQIRSICGNWLKRLQERQEAPNENSPS